MSIQISGSSIPPDGTVTTAKISSGAAGDGQVLTADGAGGAAWEAAAGGGPGYLTYVALWGQSDTTAPVVTVLENTLGGTVVWTRLFAGEYVGTLAGALPGNIWGVFGFNGSDEVVVARIQSNFPDQVYLKLTDGAAGNASGVDGVTGYIELRVYP